MANILKVQQDTEEGRKNNMQRKSSELAQEFEERGRSVQQKLASRMKQQEELNRSSCEWITKLQNKTDTSIENMPKLRSDNSKISLTRERVAQSEEQENDENW